MSKQSSTATAAKTLGPKQGSAKKSEIHSPCAKSCQKKTKSASPPPPLLGPLEEVFHLLEELFRSGKSRNISKSVARTFLTIYQNLKIIRVHAIVQCQFANDLKLRLVGLKGQLENARSNRWESKQPSDPRALTALPDPSLKKIIPVLVETEKILSMLQLFMTKQPRLRLSIPTTLLKQLEEMPEDLVRFPDHLSKQLIESKTLLQRIVVLYNQLSEAYRARKRELSSRQSEKESNDQQHK